VSVIGVCAAIFALALPDASHASSIDLYPRNDSVNSLQGGELYAETFRAVGAYAQTLTFDMQTNDFGNIDPNRTDTIFRVLLTTLIPNPYVGFGGQSPVRPGSILFQSGDLILGAEADWTSFTVDLMGTPLSVGTSYAWILDAFTPFDGSPEAGARVGAVRNSFTGTSVDDAYPNGTFMFSAAGLDTAGWINLSPSDYRDLVFRMDFTDPSSGPTPPPSVPEPATLPLFATGLGLMALLAWRRRTNVRGQ
jgi:hypothetical protein